MRTALVASTIRRQARVSGAGEQLQEALKLEPGKSASVQSITKHEGDEPEAPLLLERENVAGEVDVVSGGEKGHKADHDPSEDPHSRRAVQHGSEDRRSNPTTQRPIPAHLYCQRQAVATQRP